VSWLRLCMRCVYLLFQQGIQQGISRISVSAGEALKQLLCCTKFMPTAPTPPERLCQLQRSAAALEQHLILDRSSACPFSMRSMMRPGVPTAMSMPRRSCDFWLAMGAPAGGQGRAESARCLATM
jgi:hypothetical protein